jgi:putative inorganic carbon (HCO3(-)) transporter
MTESLARNWIERIFLVAALILLFWAPIPLGSKHPLAMLVLTASTLGICGLWITGAALSRSRQTRLQPIEIAICSLFLAYTCYLGLTTLPLPLEWLQTLSPIAATHYELQALASAPGIVALSLDRGTTLELALHSASLLFLFMTLIVALNSRRRVVLFSYLLAAAGVFHAIFALLDMYLGGVLFRQPVANLGVSLNSIAGTYTNRNHFAGLMEMTLALCVGFYLFNSNTMDLRGPWRQRLRSIGNTVLGMRPWLLIATLLPLVALLSSASRGGALAVIFATIATASLIIVKRGNKRKGPKGLLVAAILAPLVLGAVLSMDRLIDRIDNLGLEDSRYELRLLGYRMIQDYALFGSGAGTFRHVYPAYEQTVFSHGRLQHHVHNDYLELLIETGIIGFALFGGAIGLWLWAIVSPPMPRGDKVTYYISLACFAGVMSLLVHSLVDWNLRIPANSLWFTALLAIGLASRRIWFAEDSLGSSTQKKA